MRFKWPVWLFVPIFCLIAVCAFAQSRYGKIDGYIVNSQGIPVPDLQVVLEHTNHAEMTDGKGHFTIENITPGMYTLRFGHISYKTKIVRDIEVQGGQVVHLNTIPVEYQILEMDGAVVTATRTARQITEVSNQMNLVSSSRIVERNSKTSAEVLREESGIFVQKTSHGGGSAVIRGFSSNQILILVDGIRLNNSIYRLGNHPYLTMIDNAIIHQMEIVRGPASVLYGSDAMGGTINNVTRKPHLSGSGLDLKYRILNRYASADQEKTSRAEFGVHSQRLAFQAGVSYKDYNDLRRGKNSRHPQIERSTNGLLQSPTGFSGYDFDSKMVYSLTPLQTLILAYQMSKKGDVPRYDKYENNDYVRWVYQPQNRDLVYLSYKNLLHNRFISSLGASISYHRQQEGRELQKEASDLMTKERDDAGTLGLTLQAHSLFRKHLFTYGADLYFDHVSSERFYVDTVTGAAEKDARGRYPDGSKYNSIGVFIQDEIPITSWWTATSGVRYSHFSTRFTVLADTTSPVQLGNIKQNFQSLTGSLGIIRNLNDKVFINVNVGQAFRTPNLSDLAKLGESKGNTYEVPNPDLVPEKMFSFDIGLKFDFPRTKANISVYYSRITDILASADATFNGSSTIESEGNTYKVKTKKNIGNAYIRGLEASFESNFYRQFSIRANITTTFGQNTTLSEPVGKIPPTFGTAGLRWDSRSTYYDMYIRAAAGQTRLSADDRDDPRIPEGGTPGWYTLNYRTGIDLYNFGKLLLAVENILDTNYREHCSGVNGPGRNFIVSLELKN